MDVAATFGHALSSGNIAALPLALTAGLIAGLNPCCVGMYPAAAACCVVPAAGRRIAARNAAILVLGIAAALMGLGLLAVWLGRIAAVAKPLQYGIALLPIVMGLSQLHWIHLPLPQLRTLGTGAAGAFGTGLLLSLVIGPCGTPVLASVLSFAAYKQSFLYGGLLLFTYGIGNGLPLAIVGTAFGASLQRRARRGSAKWIEPLVGGSLILLGLYLLWRI